MALAVGVIGACGGGGDGGARSVDTRVGASDPTALIVSGTECGFDGDRQVTARGVVRNSGEKPYHVSISVRFVDADGVRVDIGTDSVSDLQPRESARWDVSVYGDAGDDVDACEVTAKGS